MATTEEIQQLEEMVRRRERELESLRQALAAMKGEIAGAKKKAPATKQLRPFAKKYSETSAVLALRALRAAKSGMTSREVIDALAADGKEFSEQALTHALKKLEKEGKVRRFPAPKNSAANYIWRVASGAELGEDAEGSEGSERDDRAILFLRNR